MAKRLLLIALPLAATAFGAERSLSTGLTVNIPSGATLTIAKSFSRSPASRVDLEGLTNFSYVIRDEAAGTATVQLELTRQHAPTDSPLNGRADDVLRWSCFRDGINKSCSGEHVATTAVQTAVVRLSPTANAIEKYASLRWKLSDEAFRSIGAKTTLTLTISGL